MLLPKPPHVSVRDKVLRTCAHGDCQAHRIWTFTTCAGHLTAEEKDALRGQVADALRTGQILRDAILSGANLEGIDFTRVDLSNSFLDHTNLRRANLTEANLRHAYLGWADLREANLTRTEIDGAVFTFAKLRNVDLLAYSLSNGREPINLTAESFAGPGLFTRPRIDESEPYFTEHAYQALKRYFSSKGDYDSASWASFCERTMQRKVAWDSKNYGLWLGSRLFGLLCGYGEKPFRVILSALAIIVVYAVAYWRFDLVGQNGLAVPFPDAFFFSAGVFSGYAFPDLLPMPDYLARLLTSSEGFIGILILGVFIFTLTKRYVAR